MSIAKILVLSFFPAFEPPRSGGELRLRELYMELSQYADITLLTSTDFGARQEEIRHSDTFREIRFGKEATWRSAYEALSEADVQGELSGIAFSLAVADGTCPLRLAARSFAQTVDLVIHDFPYSEPIFSDGCPVPEIYNSHNFELGLLPSILAGSGANRIFSKIRRMEARLCKRASLVLATSEDDLFKFRLMYGLNEERLSLCPNGFDVRTLEQVDTYRREHDGHPSGRPYALFMGSAHRPNVDAGNYILDLAAEVPEIDFILAGKVTGLLRWDKLRTNTRIIDDFSASEKVELLAGASFYLNPILEGSGTNIKTIEALAAGIPLISTSAGVRGLQVRHGRDCLISNRGEFRKNLCELLYDREKCSALRSNGSAFAFSGYSWRQLASRLWNLISDFGLMRHRKLSVAQLGNFVLALNDYDVSLSNSGGSVRIIETLNALNIDVVLVTFSEAFAVGKLGDRVLNVRIPKGVKHLESAMATNERHFISANDIIAAAHAPFDDFLEDICADIIARASVLTLEHCYMGTLLDLVRRLNPSISVIYSAHNVEAELKAKLLHTHPLGAGMIKFVADLEKTVCFEADAIITCSMADQRYFERFGKPVLLAPNGASSISQESLEVPDPEIIIGFLGSAHPPNVEALDFILSAIAPHFVECTFEIIGSVCGDRLGRQRNVFFRGVLEESFKDECMRSWTVALNPVVLGGGTSLKLADFLAHGIATLSTPEGIRGFEDALSSDAALSVPLAQFAATLRQLLGDQAAIRRLGDNARAYAVAHLSWATTCRSYRHYVNHLLSQRHERRLPQSKLLIVTYRYTEPALGGAEEYLIETVKRLRSSFSRIDLVAPNVVEIANFRHFGCRFSEGKAGAARVVGEYFDHIGIFKPDFVSDEEQISLCRLIEKDWRANNSIIAENYLDDLLHTGAPVRLGGFYDLEFLNGTPYRWTTGEFSIAAPAGTELVRLTGRSRYWKACVVEVFRRWNDGSLIPITRLPAKLQKGSFTLDIKMPSLGPRDAFVLKFRLDEHFAENDHRPLGVQIEAISTLTSEIQANASVVLDALAGPTLLQGWHVAGDPKRKSGHRVEADFSLVVPPGCKSLSLVGNASEKVVIHVNCRSTSGMEDPTLIYEPLVLVGDFAVSLNIPSRGENNALVFQFSAAGNASAATGILFEEVTISFAERFFPATGPSKLGQASILSSSDDDISASFQEKLRTEDLGAWIRLSVTAAAQREEAVEKAFAAVRGPHSREMQAWLAQAANEYDVVLVQGIPFDVIPATIETLSSLENRPRLIALPHFHGDDRFYYWSRYFKAFGAADTTVLFSPFVAAQLNGVANFSVIPGGGVSVYEMATGRDKERFRILLGSFKPFFLILGRKTPSKGYMRTVAAWRMLRSSGLEVDLVLVGHDEDGEILDDEGIFCLGSQPREIVLAALSECIAVVNMSVSEGFGIVLCEAWANSKPVIVNSQCLAFSELVTHGQNGISVGSDDELYAALQQLATNSDLADKLGAEGAKSVRENFSWERVTSSLAEILDPRFSTGITDPDRSTAGVVLR
ncbi:glycosyltransferase, group 1 family protein [Acetobacteraceae bacterium AT-5844]|nr:glycosyltransferase, group 1 family protein [Acetobacteraceae bacterium AT-5844]